VLLNLLTAAVQMLVNLIDQAPGFSLRNSTKERRRPAAMFGAFCPELSFIMCKNYNHSTTVRSEHMNNWCGGITIAFFMRVWLMFQVGSK